MDLPDDRVYEDLFVLLGEVPTERIIRKSLPSVRRPFCLRSVTR